MPGPTVNSVSRTALVSGVGEQQSYDDDGQGEYGYEQGVALVQRTMVAKCTSSVSTTHVKGLR